MIFLFAFVAFFQSELLCTYLYYSQWVSPNRWRQEFPVFCAFRTGRIWYRVLEHVTWIISLLYMTNYSPDQWLSPPHKVTLLVLKHSNVRLDKLLRLSDQQAIYSRFIKKDYSNIAFEVRLCRQSSHLTVRWYSIKYQASLITLCPYPSAVQMNSNLLLPGPMQPRLPLHHGQSDKGMREDIMCSSHKSCL